MSQRRNSRHCIRVLLVPRLGLVQILASELSKTRCTSTSPLSESLPYSVSSPMSLEMAPTSALIPWDPDANQMVLNTPENSRPDSGSWALVLKALLSPSPGRTLDEIYTCLGKVLEKQANRAAYTLGLGPHVVAQKIKSYFGKGEERVQRLELLRTEVPPELKKLCLKVMKYALPCVFHMLSDASKVSFPALKLPAPSVRPSKTSSSLRPCFLGYRAFFLVQDIWMEQHREKLY